MIVKLADEIYVDLESGAVGDVKLSKAKGARVVDFFHRVNIPKIKPAGRGILKKKVGDVYVSSKKMSLWYILSYYMLKEGKKKLVGFYPYREHSFIFIEATNEGNKRFSLEYKVIDDYTPQSFKELEGKYYDTIFGATNLTNIVLPFEALHKELLKGTINPKPSEIVLVSILVVVAVAVGYYFLSEWTKPPVKVAVQKAPPPPPLSDTETLRLKQAVSSDLLRAYVSLLGGLGGDRILKTMTMSITTSAMTVDGALNVTYASYYPFNGSAKNGDVFTWPDSVTKTKKREDIPSLAPVRGFDGCMNMLLDMKDVELVSRSGSDWRFTFKLKEYKNAVKLLNSLYMCPFVMESLNIVENEASGGFVMQQERK